MSVLAELENSSSNQQLIQTVFTDVGNLIKEKQHVPVSTYRVQLNRYFTFQQAREQVAYLNRLGISDLYASPFFKARHDSLHGYDISNHNELNPNIGTEADLAELAAELGRQGMGQILDTVPNHMGINETGNTWWMDVLENGRTSLYATYFDIDWDPINPKLTNKVLLPVLGAQYGQVLENKELQIRFEPLQGAFWLDYWETHLPINPRSYIMILEHNQAELIQELGETSDSALEYQSIQTALSHLPRRYETDQAKRLERNREKEIIKRRLAALCAQQPRVTLFIQRQVDIFNGQPDNPASFDLLNNLLEEQSYRLSFWRVAAEEINYRRFFDVNELAALQVDDPQVFEATHRKVLQFLAEGKLNGLRIDHVDGLRDPAGYFQDLQRHYFLTLCRKRLDEAIPEAGQRQAAEQQLLEMFERERQAYPQGPFGRPLFVVVEKILGRSESLPSSWSVCGTTGYEYTNAVNGLFVDPATQKAFDEIYSGFIGTKTRFADLVYEKKKQIMRLSLASEVTLLTNMLNHLSQRDRRYRDFTISALRNAIREVIAFFPVYRTYITRQHTEVDRSDRAHIETALNRAKKRNQALEPTVFDFIRDLMLLNFPANISEDDREARYNFVLKFQQCTGPVMAKGLEDTAFYVYNRLISLNEVGGEPEHWGNTLANFHRQQQERQRNWPFSVLTTSTHDTKRSEDVRARISVLSELPREWRTALTRWARANRKHKRVVDGQLAPDRNEEYFIYQTLLGVWPYLDGRDGPAGAEAIEAGEYRELITRLQNYMRKALNEAKVNSSWVNQNENYLAAVCDFVARILERGDNNRFLKDFVALQRKVAHYGAFNSLAQVLLKITSPGLPDFYQGNEIWDFSLVDPDNRRPVDYALRRRLLAEVEQVRDAEAAQQLVAARHDGRIKLFVTARALSFRRDNRRLFQKGSYTALEARGPRQDNLCAYARSLDDRQAVVVAPRLLAGPAKEGQTLDITGRVWEGTWLGLPGAETGQSYRNIFTGEEYQVEVYQETAGLPLDRVLGKFPVALLEKI